MLSSTNHILDGRVPSVTTAMLTTTKTIVTRLLLAALLGWAKTDATFGLPGSDLFSGVDPPL